MRARLDDTIDIASNPTLFGSRREPGLVSLAQDKTGEMILYRRQGHDLKTESVTFQPFLWLSELDVVRNLEMEYFIEELQGDSFYRYLIHFSSWKEAKIASDHISKLSGKYPGHPESPQIFLNDPSTQFLLSSGQTYYNSMAIEEVKILLLRVYLATDLESDPLDPQRIVAVAIKEGLEGETHLICDENEDKLLWHLSAKIKKLDPDLIAGHNLYKRELESISTRAKKLKVKLDWGRGGERLSSRRSRTNVAEKQLDYQRYQVAGRELADSWILSILHDVSGREMLGYDFIDVAQHFHLSLGSVDDSLEERARKDTAALASLHRSLLYPYFLQSQIFPLTFEDVMLRGNATRINHIFLRDYYRLRHSIPNKPEVVHFAGGLTAQEHSGCAYGVYHCDVASLYPSLIITFDLGPTGDELGIFTGLLETLRDFRFLAKAKQKDAKTEKETAFFGNLQTTFKILINSFYGYLGFGHGHFGDFAKAAEVTRRGRELLEVMMTWLKNQEAKILEVDTDGIYFVPSTHFLHPGWIEKLNDELPDGVQVEFDGCYPAMYCHKMKNYALLEESGHLILRGSGLRSRALEPFLRQFIEDLIRNALTNGAKTRNLVLEQYLEKLKNGGFSVHDLAKTETLIDSPGTYAKKIEQGGRNRAAVYELALSADQEYHAGESISYFVVGDKATVTVYDHAKRVQEFEPNSSELNLKYYAKKLKATFKKFDPILSKEELHSPVAFAQLPRP